MYESTSHSGAQTQQEGGTNDIAERLRRLEDSSRHSSGWGDTLKDLNAQVQRLQGGGGSLEPLSNISGWKLTSGFTDPTLAGGATFVGQGQMLLAGSGIVFSKPANSQFLEIASSGGSGLMNADYVVDAAGHGDYLTLYGAAGALQAAIATGVSKFIWLCTTHTETVSAQEVLPALAANQQIIIASGTRERATITWALAGTTGCMSFPAKNASTSISFKSFRFARTAGTGALIVPAAGGPSIMDIEFEDMDFYKNGSTFDALVGGSLLAAMTGNNLTVRGCTGAGALVIHQLGATSNGLGLFIMEDCSMTLDGINRHSSSTSVDWGMSGTGQIMRNNFISHNSGFRLLQQNYTSSVWHFDNNVVISAYAGICIVTGNVQTGSNIHICNNTYQASAVGAQFLSVGSATSNIKNVIMTGNSLDGPGSGTAISTTFVNTGALPDSIWLAPNAYRDWTTNFNGFAGGATDNWTIVDSTGASATAPTTVNYLIGTADTSLASAIVVGTTPGGELGGTWASPTVDATHSGSAHHTQAHVFLSADHSDTTAAAVTKGAIIRGNVAGTAWETLAVGASADGLALVLSGGIPVWGSAGGGGGSTVAQYYWAPDAAPTATVTIGDQQGNVYHSSTLVETATKLYVDAETAPDASGLPITIQYGDTNDLDTVTVWTEIITYTLSSEKTASSTSFTNASIPPDRLLRMNVGIIVGTPADVTITLVVTRAQVTAQSIVQHIFIPDAAPAATVVAGNQQGNTYHSGPSGMTADRLYVDAETAPGAAGLPITVQYGDTDDLDTVAVWTTIATYTLSSEKSNFTNTMANATVPADRLMRMNVGVIVGTPADVTVTLVGLRNTV